MTEQEIDNIFIATVRQRGALSDEDFQKIRLVLAEPNFRANSHMFGVAQLRMVIELIESIRRFDRASGDSVETTNKLTSRIYVLTRVMVAIGVANVVASAWHPLAYFVASAWHLLASWLKHL